MATPTTPKDDNFLTTIRKYESCLGHGAFGIVLKAVTDSVDTPSATAVKFLFPTDTDEKVNQQILRESTITNQLVEHENVVRVIGVANTGLTATEVREIFSDEILQNEEQRRQRDAYEGTAKRFNVIPSVCIQMELCGENLRQWLSEYKEDDLQNVCVQLQQMIIIKNIIAGLKYLHDNKIIHRDLKPANIMFSSAKYRLPVKIGDFGLSRKIHSEETQTGSLTKNVGTMAYMAPEVRYLDLQYSYQADMYSLGLIIWEVVQFVKVNLFDQLVYDENEGLVKEHALIDGVKKVVIGLTKRNTEKRFKRLDDIGITLKQNINVKNSPELELCLEYAEPGCDIMLAQGIFFGPFTLKQDKVSVRGVVGTVIQCEDAISLQILGNDSIISDIKIVSSKDDVGMQLVGSSNIIKNVNFTGGDCIAVEGHTNRLENLTILNSHTGIIIRGSNNVIDNINLANIKQCGIIVAADSIGNNISNISGSNVTHGIKLHGPHNNLLNITFTKDSDRGDFLGLDLFSSGSFNTVHNFNCSGYLVANHDWGLRIGSNNSTISESKCGPILINGSNTTLTNVDCGGVTSVEVDVESLNLKKCRGIKIEVKTLMKNVTMIECEYQGEQVIEDIFPVVEKVVRTGPQLRKCLSIAKSGWVIVLEEGEYFGPFELKQDNVRIVGRGSGTIIKSKGYAEHYLQVIGNGCIISNLDILLRIPKGIILTGSKNHIRNVTFSTREQVGKISLAYWVEILGDKNKLENLNVNGGGCGIRLHGCKNFVDQVKLRNLYLGIDVDMESNHNSISNINCQNLDRGIEISGSFNSISNVTFEKSTIRHVFNLGVELNGVQNKIDNLTCCLDYLSENDWDLLVESKGSTVQNSKCNRIWVTKDNVTLTNVDCKRLIAVNPSALGIKMVKCRGRELAASDNVTLIESNFETGSSGRWD